MKLAVLHYHFQPGGVSQVVRTHLQGLAHLPPQRRPSEVLLIGGRDLGPSALPFEPPPQISVVHRLCRSLDYAPPVHSVRHGGQRGGPPLADGAELAATLSQLLQQAGWDPAESVLHWHNPTLGKNAAVTGAIRRLAGHGWRMLLQIHDFAEDYRPQNYGYLIAALAAADPRQLESQLYPQAPTIHYATLTSSDRQHLRSIEVPENRLHVVPNAVSPPPLVPAADADATARQALQRLGLPAGARLFLYPVRGIRRKNVGELLLLSMLSRHDAWYAITLPPTTPVERVAYERWRRLAQTLQLPVRFDVGLHRQNTLADNLAAAAAVVSTSVAEGFGLVFLEPWLAQRSLIARDLPSVTGDLRRAGLHLPSLYRSLPVPLGPADAKAARAEIAAAWQQVWQDLPAAFRPASGPPMMALERDSQTPAGIRDGDLDFALLTADRQQAVLRRLASDSGFAAAMRDACADVLTKLSGDGDAQRAVISKNAATVRETYAPARQGEQLAAIYTQLLDAPRPGAIQGPTAAGALWTRFLSGEEPFRPCRTEVLADR